MERIAAAHVDTPVRLRVPRPAGDRRAAARAARATSTLGYGDGAPCSAASTGASSPASRIGLLGRNGAGKSTLLKLIAGDAARRSPARGTRAQALAIGYFAQHQVEQLRADESPLRHLARIDPAAREQELRDFLGGFDFRGDMVDARRSAASPAARRRG